MIQANLARIAVIGSGELAHAYRQALREVSGARRIAVAIPGEIDAVVICDKAIASSDQVGEWLERGVGVLCHAQLLADPQQTRRAMAASKQSAAPLAIMHPPLFAADVKQAANIIAAGLLGDCLTIEVAPLGIIHSADDAIAASCIGIDLARRMLGVITQLQVCSFRSSRCAQAVDAWHIFLQNADQAIGEVVCKPARAKSSSALLSFHGTQGDLFVATEESRYRAGASESWIAYGHGFQKHAALRAELTHFLDCLRGIAVPIFAPRDILLAAELWGVVASIASAQGWQALATSPNGALFAALAAARAS